MSTSFNLEVSFTGICAFFSNSNTTGQKYNVCVVMPGGVDGYQALDEELLCRHDSYLVSSPDSDGPPLAPIELKDSRVSFSDPVLPAPPVTLPPASPIGSPSILTDLGQVVDLAQYPLDPNIAGTDPPRVVGSQILLTWGTLTNAEDPSQDLWNVAGIDKSPGIKQAVLAHKVIWKVQDLRALSVFLLSFRGLRQEIDLTAVSAKNTPPTVKLEVVNGCKAIPSLPLKVSIALRDRDFKWYFELLGSQARDDIRNFLSRSQPNADLPVPRYIKSGPLIGGGADCYPIQGGTLAFE